MCTITFIANMMLYNQQKLKRKKPHLQNQTEAFIEKKDYLIAFFGCGGSLLLFAGFLYCSEAVATLSCGAQSFSLQWLLLMQSTGSGHSGFSCCSSQAPECWLVAVVPGFITLRHVGSSCIRDQTGVPCTARQILNHWTTREAL